MERLEAVLQKSMAAANATWDKYLASMSGEQPDITENEAELASLRGTIEAQRISQTAAMRSQYDDTLRTLTVSGNA